MPPVVTNEPTQWAEDRRELALACDDEGRIIWADSTAQRRLGAQVGQSFFALAAPGTGDKARAFLQHARREQVKNAELALLVGATVATFSFGAKPDGKGGTLLLGSDVPAHYSDNYSHMQESMGEMADLHRQIVHQKRELQQKNDELERASTRVTEVLESLSDAF